MMLMRVAAATAPRAGGRALTSTAVSPLLLIARRAAAATSFACAPASRLMAQPPVPTAIRLLSLHHSARSVPLRLASQRCAPTLSRFSTSSTEKPLTQFERLKDLWKKYGIVAIGTYLSMYGVVLGSIYVAIDQGWVNTTKKPRGPSDTTNGGGDEDFNLVTATNKFVTLAEDLGIAKYLEVERVNAKTGTFLIAWVATKFTEPVRLAVTLAITPRIARFFGRAPQLKAKVRKP